MAVEKLFTELNGRIFCVEKNPDNSGVRLLQRDENGKVYWLGTAVNCGNEVFSLATSVSGQIFTTIFPINTRLMTENGYALPLKVENQIEINIGGDKQIVARYLDPDNIKKGFVVGYSDGKRLWGVAIFEIRENELLLIPVE